MKKKHQLLLGMLVAFILCFTTNCDNASQNPDCKKGGDIVHRVDEVEGRITFNDELQARVITYFVPGTIDSMWSGAICNDNLPEFEFGEGQKIRFSGNFRDDNNELETQEVFGGQEFFYLEVTSVQMIF